MTKVIKLRPVRLRFNEGELWVSLDDLIDSLVGQADDLVSEHILFALLKLRRDGS